MPHWSRETGALDQGLDYGGSSPPRSGRQASGELAEEESGATPVTSMDYPLDLVSRFVLAIFGRGSHLSLLLFLPRNTQNLDCNDRSFTPSFQFGYYKGTAEAAGNGTAPGETESSHVGPAEPDQSVMGIMEAVAGSDVREDEGHTNSAQSTGNMNPQAPGWTKR